MELPIIAKLNADLVEFQREMQFDLPRRLEEARAHGDLRENAEYDAAKQRQGEIRARIERRERRHDVRHRECRLHGHPQRAHG